MTDVAAIDLSHWNTVDSFKSAKNAGVLGVIHKCTESDDYVDPTYEQRRRDADAAGVLWGAYHFLRPGNMQAQAEFFVQNVGNFESVLLAADHEDDDVSLDDLKQFLRVVAELTGQMPVIYSGNVIKEQLGQESDDFLAQHRLWLAQYSDKPSWPYATWPTWWLWQFTDKGSVPGMAGDTDCNRFNGDALQLIDEWSGPDDVRPVPPAPEPDEQTVEITITIGITVPPGVKVKINPVT